MLSRRGSDHPDDLSSTVGGALELERHPSTAFHRRKQQVASHARLSPLARQLLGVCTADRTEQSWAMETTHAGCSTIFPCSRGAGCLTARRISSTIAGTSTPAFLRRRRAVRVGTSPSIPTTCPPSPRSGTRS